MLRLGRLNTGLPLLVLLAATASLWWIVPEPPWRNLDDPMHWGVLGYFLTLGLLVGARLLGGAEDGRERSLFAVFLAAMPLVYLASWLRFAGPRGWLWIELAGAVGFGAVAWIGLRRAPGLIALGIAGHALWDAWHHGRTEFVADWYALGCAVIDGAVAIYVAGRLPAWIDRDSPEPSSS